MPSNNNQIGSKKNVIIILCLLILSLLITWQTFRRAFYRVTSDFYHPYLNLPVQTEKYLSEKSLLLESKNRLASALTKLKNDNDRLRAENVLYQNLKSENRELRKMMNLSLTVRGEVIFADIIVRDPLYWNERFTINKGSEDGVKSGSLVLAIDQKRNKVAVVGRVTATSSKHSASVFTIINQESQLSRLSVKLPDSNVIGILEGAVSRGGKVYARLIWLPKDRAYQIGESVVTSGISNYTIPAIYVGTVADYDGTGKASMLKNRLYKEAFVEPAIDIESLKTVMVIIKK